MGEVWIGTNLTLDLPVAIKLLRGKDSVDGEGHRTISAALEEHLLREAQATAKLSHPAIVRVFDFGVTGFGDPYIVMERLEGEDLRDRLTREGAIPAEASVQLLLPVIHAMHTAHLRGIVHRDLKPENIFLASDEGGRVAPKVVDFGIAELPWLTDQADSIIAGTPAYMAPEQAAGHPNADHRVDIWAVCVALYEMIGGTTPFTTTGDQSFERDVAKPDGARDAKDTEVDATQKNLAPVDTSATDPIPLGDDRGVDETLWKIIARGLSRAPAKRWRSMRELGEALAEWLFARGVEEDVRGTSLKARWLYDPATRQSLVTPTPAPVAVSAPKAASVATSDPSRRGSGVVVREEPAVARNEDAVSGAASPTPSAPDREPRPSSKHGAESKRVPRLSRWVAMASLGLAAALGALALKATQTAPAPKVERSVGRSVDLLLLEALRSTHPTAAPPTTSASARARSTPEPRPSKRDHARDTPRDPSPPEPSSSPSAEASSAPPATPTAAPSADPATQIYPDSL